MSGLISELELKIAIKSRDVLSYEGCRVVAGYWRGHGFEGKSISDTINESGKRIDEKIEVKIIKPICNST